MSSVVRFFFRKPPADGERRWEKNLPDTLSRARPRDVKEAPKNPPGAAGSADQQGLTGPTGPQGIQGVSDLTGPSGQQGTPRKKAPLTTLDFWDCECPVAYIHPKSVRHCPRCDTRPDEQPDSRVVEVEAERERTSGPHFICSECCTERGAVWPEGHCATCHSGTCWHCLRYGSLAAVDDWDWPKGSKRPPGYGGGRD